MGLRPRIPRLRGSQDARSGAGAVPGPPTGGPSTGPRGAVPRGRPREQDPGRGDTARRGAADSAGRDLGPGSAARRNTGTGDSRLRNTGAGEPARGGAGSPAGRGGSGSSTVAAPVPAHTFNGRLIALIVVAAVILFLAAPTAKIYVDQRAQIAELEQDIAQQRQQQQELKKEEQRWADDAYVEQQARERMGYVKPGESAYLVLGARPTTDEPLDSSAQQVEAGKPAWADGLWRSVLDSAFPDDSPRVVPEDTGDGPGDPEGASNPTGAQPSSPAAG